MTIKIHSPRRDLIASRAKLKFIILAHLIETGPEKSHSLMNRLAEKYITHDATLTYRVTRDLKDTFESLINIGFIAKSGKGSSGTMYTITSEGIEYFGSVKTRYKIAEVVAEYLLAAQSMVKARS